MSGTGHIRVYGYRWVILVVYALITAVLEVHWVNFAPITGEAARFYGVSPLEIGFLSMSFMLVYLVVCIPASYVIDTYGIRIGIGIGAVLTGMFGLLKGLYAADYQMILFCQIGLAVAQPFILNAITKVAANWFPLDERATAAGLATLSQFIGIILAMVLTPQLLKGSSMHTMLMVYGAASAACALVCVALMREAPPTPPSHVTEQERFRVFEGLRHIFAQRDMRILMVIFFIGLGMFNAVTTWIEQILAPRGFGSEQAGLIGAMMMIGGIAGAICLPLLSDRLRRRKPFLLLTMIGTVPGLIGLTFLTGYGALMVSSFVLGFFVMAAGPIGFQYGAEVSYPAPESTSQGLILLSGQVSGVIFIFGMDAFRTATTHSMTPFMIVFIALTCLNLVMGVMIKESPLVARVEDRSTDG
ncbi:MAG TPA: MFS transporter [Deltaproteobacteria bacterium]|nr:MFS transporter [Deltaproteobacteria bacterium]